MRRPCIKPVPVEIIKLIEYIKKGNFGKLLSEQELFKSVNSVETAEIILSTVITTYKTKPGALVDNVMALMDIMPANEVIDGGMKSMLALGLKALSTILESAELPPEELFALLSQRATNSPNRDQFIRRIFVRKRDHHFEDALIGRIFPRLGKEHLLATLELESVAPTIFPVDNIPLLENRVRSVLSMLKTTDASYTEVMPLFHKAGFNGLILRFSVLQPADSGIPAVALILEHYPLLVKHILADGTMSPTVAHRYVQALTSAITHLPADRIFPVIEQELHGRTPFLHHAISTQTIPATLFTSVLQRLPVTLRQAALQLTNSTTGGTSVIHAALANSAWREQRSNFLETILVEIPSSSLLSILRLRDYSASRLTVMHYALGYGLEAATIHLEAIHKALIKAETNKDDIEDLFSMKTNGKSFMSYLISCLTYGAPLVSLIIGKYPFLSYLLPPPLTTPAIATPSWAAASHHAPHAAASPRVAPWAAAIPPHHSAAPRTPAVAPWVARAVVEPNLAYEYTDIDITEILTARMQQEGISTAGVQVLTVSEDAMLVPCISSSREVHPGSNILLISFNPVPNRWLGILLEFSSARLARAIYINPIEIGSMREDPYFARAQALLRPLLHDYRLATSTTPILRGRSAVESGPYVIENLLSAARREEGTPAGDHAAVRRKQLESLKATSLTAFDAFCVRQSRDSRPSYSHYPRPGG